MLNLHYAERAGRGRENREGFSGITRVHTKHNNNDFITDTLPCNVVADVGYDINFIAETNNWFFFLLLF